MYHSGSEGPKLTGSVLSKGTRIPEPNLASSASLMGLPSIVQNFQSRRKRDPSWRGVGASRTGKEQGMEGPMRRFRDKGSEPEAEAEVRSQRRSRLSPARVS